MTSTLGTLEVVMTAHRIGPNAATGCRRIHRGVLYRVSRGQAATDEAIVAARHTRKIKRLAGAMRRMPVKKYLKDHIAMLAGRGKGPD